MNMFFFFVLEKVGFELRDLRYVRFVIGFLSDWGIFFV